MCRAGAGDTPLRAESCTASACLERERPVARRDVVDVQVDEVDVVVEVRRQQGTLIWSYATVTLPGLTRRHTPYPSGGASLRPAEFGMQTDPLTAPSVRRADVRDFG